MAAMNGRLLVGIILILIGIGSLTGVNIFRFLFPLLLIWWGYTIITGRRIGDSGTPGVSSESTLNEVLIFSGTNRKIQTDTFSGGKVITIFGGAEFDLTDVKTKSTQLQIELVSIFGGVKLRVPETWEVRSEAVAVLGGVTNKTARSKKSDVVVKVTGATIFGSIELEN